ncbi:MAG: Coq4 family protein [Cyanobacteriota bacterium]|nr:Coq4 family protein [Cyanobacteriota bacterium]
MGFKYIDALATPENLEKLVTLTDMVVGVRLETSNVFDIEDALRDSPLMQKCLTKIHRDPASAKALEERYMGEEYDLEKMLEMPPHSLGWTYAKILTALGYDPNFYRLREIKSDVDYITHRVRKSHDLHHILTGFSFDDYGELGVISVTAGQIGYPAFILIALLGSFLAYLTDAKRPGIDNPLEYNFDMVSAGVQMARHAKPLFPIKWEDNLDRSLEELRSELNIQPVTTGLWSWYTRPLLQEVISA